MKVMAMQEDVTAMRKTRLSEEKEAFGSTQASISLNASTRKYIFPPIATMSTLSRSPKGTPFDTWASASPDSKTAKLGRRKMKYLAEVYLPQALAHLDQSQGAMSKTLPSGGSLPKLGSTDKKGFSKTGGAKPDKTGKPQLAAGEGVFLQSF